MSHEHALLAPSAWVQRWSHLVPGGARVLDVACGSGRHVRWFAGRGARVTAIDRDAEAMQRLHDIADVVVADIEAGPWPLGTQRFDAVVVTNYLWRPLLPTIVGSVDAGGVLIYETFARGNEAFGKPSNPAFLLEPGELLAGTRGLRTLAFEEGALDAPPRVVQRVVAQREPAHGWTPSPLQSGATGRGG
jgi:SAM-dependent methyltransferase